MSGIAGALTALRMLATEDAYCRGFAAPFGIFVALQKHDHSSDPGL
jgi:hypothetical protein